MEPQILIGLIFTILPITELRVGLPIIIEYLTREGISIWPYFFLVLLVNIAIVPVIFLFLDFLHEFATRKSSFYNKSFKWTLKKAQKRINKIKNSFGNWKYIILMLFVAVPLPGTGAWTGTLIAWATNLERIKSIIAISIGIIIAGLLVLFASVGFFSLF
jgi:uncharacterized membrane protein